MHDISMPTIQYWNIWVCCNPSLHLSRNWGLLPVLVTAWHSQATTANDFTSHKWIRCWIPSQFAEQKPLLANHSHVWHLGRALGDDWRRNAKEPLFQTIKIAVIDVHRLFGSAPASVLSSLENTELLEEKPQRTMKVFLSQRRQTSS